MNNIIYPTNYIIRLTEKLMINENKTTSETIRILRDTGLDDESINIVISYFDELIINKKKEKLSDRLFLSVFLFIIVITFGIFSFMVFNL